MSLPVKNCYIDDKILIEKVRQYEELYNTDHKKYIDSSYKDKIWAKIGTEVNSTGSMCKLRWVSLRDQLRKFLKKKVIKIGQAEITHKWKYEDRMSFLIPFFKQGRTSIYRNIPVPEITNEDCNDARKAEASNKITVEDGYPHMDNKMQVLFQELVTNQHKLMQIKPKSRKARDKPMSASTEQMTYLIQENKTESDKIHHIDAFFHAMAATVKNFSPYYQYLAKSKIFSAVSQLEFAQLQDSSDIYYTNKPIVPTDQQYGKSSQSSTSTSQDVTSLSEQSS